MSNFTPPIRKNVVKSGRQGPRKFLICGGSVEQNVASLNGCAVSHASLGLSVATF